MASGNGIENVPTSRFQAGPSARLIVEEALSDFNSENSDAVVVQASQVKPLEVTARNLEDAAQSGVRLSLK
jgi:hypothetical protein